MKNGRKECNYGHRRIASNLRKTGQCILCSRIRARQQKIEYRRTHPYIRNPDRIRYPRHCSPRDRFTDSKYRVEKKNRPWKLDFDFYCSMISKPCFYCGGPLSKSKTGLDRIDSSKGYLPTNVRPCCKTCNVMKNAHSESFFFSHILTILKHTKRI